MDKSTKLVRDQYEDIWRSLQYKLQNFSTSYLVNYLPPIDELTGTIIHELVKEIYHYPKSIMVEYLKGQIPKHSSPDPGSITGLFFEDLMADIFSVYHPKAKTKLYRNFIPDPALRDACKVKLGVTKPDLYFELEGTHHFIEMKFKGTTPFLSGFSSIQKKIKEGKIAERVEYWGIIGWSSIEHKKLKKEDPDVNDHLCILDGVDSALDIVQSQKYLTIDALLCQIFNPNKDSIQQGC